MYIVLHQENKLFIVVRMSFFFIIQSDPANKVRPPGGHLGDAPGQFNLLSDLLKEIYEQHDN